MADLTPPALNDASPFADMRGHHVAVRTPDFEIAKRWYVASLDFRVVAEWDYADQRLGYLASPVDDRFCIETIVGGEPVPQDVRPYSHLGGTLDFAGYHHFCLSVVDGAETLEELRARGVTIVAEPFVVEAIGRKLAFSPILSAISSNWLRCSPPASRTPSKQTAKRG
ncbi:VOC family protein [Sphingomonas psychrotolerans]|uniref:VOC family protein n=1 Tax=Sphingomonas psychrotolerans TaxID=1327635 RepID=UPI001F255F58|nr:VOC family protein [Sphingomonas psychrotolerans]